MRKAALSRGRASSRKRLGLAALMVVAALGVGLFVLMLRSGRSGNQTAPAPSAANAFYGHVRDTSQRAIAGAFVRARWIAGDKLPREIASTRSKADGSYRLSVTPPLERGILLVAVEAEGFGQAGRQVEPKASRQDFVLVHGNTSVTVRVVTRDGQAVAGAEVVVSMEPLAADPNAIVMFTGQSDASGRFVAEKVPVSAGKIHWSAVAVGTGRAIGVENKAASDKPITVTARLDPGKTVAGVVVDGNGRPVEAVALRVAEAQGPWVMRTQSGRDGGFRVSGAPHASEVLLTVEGDWVLANGQDALALRSADKLAAGDEPSVRVVVEPAGAIEGSVVARDAVAGAVVSAVPTDRTLGAPREVVSGTDGSFQLRGLRMNTTWELEARHPDYAPSFAEKVAAHTRGLRLLMKTGGRLAGRVLDNDRRPYADIQVYAHLISRSEPTPGSGQRGQTVTGLHEYADTHSDAEGRFVIDHLNPGDYRVEYRLAARMAFSPTAAISREAKVRDGETTTLEDAELERGGSLRILARTKTGTFPTELTVSILPSGRGGAPHRARLTGGLAGVFEMRGLEPGVYDVSVQDRRYGYASTRDVAIKAGAIAEATLEFRGSFSLTGKIVDDARAPVEGATVDAFLASGGSQATATLAGRAPDNLTGNTVLSRSDGSFEITGLEVGSHKVRVVKAGLPPFELTADIGPAAAPVKIHLPRGAELEVELGMGAAEKIVVLEAVEGGRHFQSAVTDATGKARLRALPAGSYRVSAVVPDHGAVTVTLAAGESKRVVLTRSPQETRAPKSVVNSAQQWAVAERPRK